jgi:hypothetical protein
MDDLEKETKNVTVSWAENDLQNPLQWSRRRKWAVTILTCCMSTMMYESEMRYSASGSYF